MLKVQLGFDWPILVSIKRLSVCGTVSSAGEVEWSKCSLQTDLNCYAVAADKQICVWYYESRWLADQTSTCSVCYGVDVFYFKKTFFVIFVGLCLDCVL